ncbi:mitotic spindle checkpoint protein MAD1 isoform X2 [Olea europaea var. sylvestris]|uniref:mitotic spindle checkpoint protein MAD1 isoform X2 n=1 Tax=Olea europaea var. sylvestris TaxID=158386 RepID=UPI000C1CDB4F|nr:mitotic spindle checkpoint protein MAD1 isoform X2 [Olea europaea var. sylvestris]
MILRTPPARKRRAESRPPEDNDTNIPSSNRQQLVIYEDHPVVETSHDHSTPITTDQMLCTYQCRQMVKSEFLDALSSAEKQAHDYQSKLEALSGDFYKAEAERKKFRDQFFNAEQELAAAKGREQMLQQQLRKEVDFSQEQIKKQMQSYSELEIKLRTEMDLRKKAESSAAIAEEKASGLEGKLNTLSESMEREKSRFENELAQMRSGSKLSITRISADLERMECKAKNAEKESALLKQQLEELKKRLHECMGEKFEVEKRFSRFTSLETPSKDADLLVKHLQEELRSYECEVREARKIISSHEKIDLLKEQLLEEKGRRERTESDLHNLADIQLTVKNLEDDLSTWKSMIKDIPGVSHADDIPLKFAALQKELYDSMMKVGEAQARLKRVEVALDTTLLDKESAETEAALAKERMELSKSEIKRLKLMIASLTEERDSLKHAVDEMKGCNSLDDRKELVSGTIVQLESSLAKKESVIRELENNLSEQRETNRCQLDEIKLLNERLNNEARRIKMLEREDDRLRSEIALLESKLGHGDFSSANTKVLRMVNTLAVENEAKQTIEALQNELQKTKEKLQAVEDLKKQSSDAGTLVDSYIAGNIKQLKEQIATLEKREERYKTVFADRISVFRRACCELFGYKIVMDDHQRSDGIPVTRFTLHSIYAQSDNEKLEFEYESGNMNFLANEYASHPELSRQVEVFIRKMNSIPAFTANLTVESFNKRTLS